MTYARIIGTGSYVPEKVLTNDDLSRMLGENVNDFVSQVIGIEERHICGEDESTADLATQAATRALAAANVSPADLDLIILATDTPEHLSPATSVIVQHRLGAKSAGTFDVTVWDAPTQINNLIRYVLNLGMPSGTTNPLVNQLYAALNTSVGDNHVACVKMGDFIGMVAKKGRDIQPVPSAYMTAQATQIMVVLACPAARLNAPVGTIGASN